MRVAWAGMLLCFLTAWHCRESTFRGWQLLCVLLVTFPPSKNFEPYVRSFMQERTTQTEGRVDIMAKYCLHRLSAIAKKGPRGKPPTVSEIENASVSTAGSFYFIKSFSEMLFHRMLRSTRQRLENHWMPSTVSKSARTRT